MANSFLPHDTSTTPDAQTHGTTEIRQKTIGKMIAQGLPVKYVAKKLDMSESRIYHLLSDKESIVNAEINRILEEMFTANDRYLVKLFNKTLENLDTMLSGSDKEKQFRAMDRIIKIYMARSAKNGVTVKQYFGLEPPGAEREFTIDDYVLFNRKLLADLDKRGKERGLTDHEHEDSSNSAPENSASPTPVSETAASNGSSPDNSLPETAAPNESSRGYSPPDIPAETRKFLDDMNETPPSE
jgi:hypothetical protein